MMRIALFDIDGTILSSQGAGRRALETALTDVFGRTGPSHYRYDGKTDRQIIRELMRAEGMDDAVIDARMDEVLTTYLRGLAAEISSRDVQLLPGVAALLDELEQESDVVLGLLTGNVAEGAAAKLLAVGVDMTRFRVNAFGSDHESRPVLPAIARERAMAMLGVPVEAEQIIVIGDTPLDIACAHAIGAKAVAVATGHYSVAELAAHAPAAVLADFSDHVAAARTIRSV
jgi:phosphoglycolate phosphatase-like HAD superfamily hydrolase